MDQSSSPDSDFRGTALAQTQPRLTVAISTLGARAGGICLPEARPFLRYLILVQTPSEAPLLPARRDLTVLPLDSLGLSKSRNAALEAATTPFLMVADDDTSLDLAGIETLLALLEAAPHLAFVTGELQGRRRGARGYRLTRLNTARTNSSEMLLRLAPIRAAGLRFDERFGLGASYGLGEEYIFLTDALKAGLKGWHAPVTVAAHPNQSTGESWNDLALLRARAAVFERVFGPWAPLVRLGFALRHWRRIRLFWGFVLGRFPASGSAQPSKNSPL